MEILSEIAGVAALGAVVQFVAAILGPRVLNLASFLMILAALAVVGGWALETYAGMEAPLISPVDQETAVTFGMLAGLLFLSHLIIRAIFRAMARASHA